MSDLVKQLWAWAKRDTAMSEFGPDEHIAGIAADEIERLNKEVDSLIELLRREKVENERLRDSEGKWTKAAAQETAKALEYHDEIKRLKAELREAHYNGYMAGMGDSEDYDHDPVVMEKEAWKEYLDD